MWQPPGTTSRHADHQAFLDALQRDASVQFGADLIQADLETFKTSVHAALKKLEQPAVSPAATARTEGSERLIYVLCDERDRKATVPLRKYLKANSLESKTPVFEGEAGAVRQANQELLTQCDAVIVFYGSGDESWFRSVENDLKKAAAYRGGKPPVVYTMLADPATDHKRDLIDLEEANLLDMLGGFSEEKMASLVSALQKAAKAAQ